MKTAMFPGSFDPPNVGHIDIIRRASAMFDRLIVVAMSNPGKKCRFSLEQRMHMLTLSTAGLENVSVDCHDALMVQYAAERDIRIAVKGVRTPQDFEIEMRMAMINRRMVPGLETLLIPAAPEHVFISSTHVREIAYNKGDIADFVPPEILDIVLSGF